MRLRVKTRHGPQMRDCLLRLVLPALPAHEMSADAGRASGDDPKPDLVAAATCGYVNLDTKESALAPGQFAAFYLGDECVGSGVICGWSAASAAAAGVAPEGEGAADLGMKSDSGSAKHDQKKPGGVLEAAAAAVGR